MRKCCSKEEHTCPLTRPCLYPSTHAIVLTVLSRVRLTARTGSSDELFESLTVADLPDCCWKRFVCVVKRVSWKLNSAKAKWKWKRRLTRNPRLELQVILRWIPIAARRTRRIWKPGNYALFILSSFLLCNVVQVPRGTKTGEKLNKPTFSNSKRQ